MKKFNLCLAVVVCLSFLLIPIVSSQTVSDVFHNFTGPDGSHPFVGLWTDGQEPQKKFKRLTATST